MEAPQKMVLPGEVTPVRNSSRYTRNQARHLPRNRWRSGLNAAGIIIKPDSAAAAGPESSGPEGTAGHYF